MSGLFLPFRLYDFVSGKPELSNNTFYCKEYDHIEYFSFDLGSMRLPPFIIHFDLDTPGSHTLDVSSSVFTLVCTETGETVATLTVETADFTMVVDGNDVYAVYNPLNDFTLSDDVDMGVYHLLISDVSLDRSYDFYSDSFVIKEYINGTP